jgi:hypothetical protein
MESYYTVTLSKPENIPYDKEHMQAKLFHFLRHFPTYFAVFEYGKSKNTPHYHIILNTTEHLTTAIQTVHPYYTTKLIINNIDHYIDYIMKDEDSPDHIRLSKGDLHKFNKIPLPLPPNFSTFDILYVENNPNPQVYISKHIRHNIIKYC